MCPSTTIKIINFLIKKVKLRNKFFSVYMYICTPTRLYLHSSIEPCTLSSKSCLTCPSARPCRQFSDDSIPIQVWRWRWCWGLSTGQQARRHRGVRLGYQRCCRCSPASRTRPDTRPRNSSPRWTPAARGFATPRSRSSISLQCRKHAVPVV